MLGYTSHDAGSRTARLEGLAYALTLPGQHAQGTDHRLGASLNYSRAAHRLNFGFQSERVLGISDRHAQTSWSYWF